MQPLVLPLFQQRGLLVDLPFEKRLFKLKLAVGGEPLGADSALLNRGLDLTTRFAFVATIPKTAQSRRRDNLGESPADPGRGTPGLNLASPASGGDILGLGVLGFGEWRQAERLSQLWAGTNTSVCGYCMSPPREFLPLPSSACDRGSRFL